jgi:two-component system, sensor histidine kinase RegB
MSEITQLKLKWLIGLRWFAIMGQLAMVLPAMGHGYLTRDHLGFYLLITATLITINLFKFFKYFPKSNFLITYHVIIDLLAFCFLIVITGKMENPFWPMIYFHAAIGAAMIPLRQDYWYLPFLFGTLAFVQAHSMEFYTSIYYILIPQWIIIIAIWFLCRNLAIAIAKQSISLQEYAQKDFNERQYKSLTALTAGILHEIGTPLNTIRLKVDRLKTKGLSQFSDKDMQILNEGVENIETVVDQLNRLHANVNIPSLTPLALEPIVSVMIYKWPSLQFQLNLNPNVHILASELELELIFKIFFDNAIEASATKINLQDEILEDEVLLTIQDNGEGFSENIIENLGSPYNSTKGKGKGLGLYSAIMMLEAMGAKLHIQNLSPGAVIQLRFNRTYAN